MAPKKEKKSDTKNQPLVVGLGASAGGLESLKIFFSSLPENTGIAFIVIIHLSPEHKSNMAELLQMQTKLEVLQVKERVEIQPDHVYVIPPNKMLAVGDNHLTLSKPTKAHGLATVDWFMRSLAEVKGKSAACIILSGTGSDGTIGMKAIKEHGGLTIAQDPDEAQYPQMPLHAIETGLIDKVLPAREIARELVEYSKNFSQVSISDDPQALAEEEKKLLPKILKEVRIKTGHDFNNYKQNSVLRRLGRRMRVNRVNKLSDYFSYMNNNPEEVEELLKDLLISVTNFFRNPEAFQALEKEVIPHLFEQANGDDPLRIWIPGCATGEEAYSIAILMYEQLQSRDKGPGVQIFATDIDESALNTGRAGIYPESISGDLTTRRLRRFFKKEGDAYRVRREIRDMILFASHDLLRDPPFSKLDLIACRNLLIYLNRELQSEVFNLFHYALRPGGWLFLGLSDSNLEAKELFSPVNKEFHIYKQRKASKSQLSLPDIPLRFNKRPTTYSTDTASQRKENFEKLHRNLLIRLYAPQSVLINDNYNVIHATDEINKYLEYSGGEPSRNILDMVKKELRQPLRSLLFQSQKDDSDPISQKVHVNLKAPWENIQIEVRKISDTDFQHGLIHVVFQPMGKAENSHSKDTSNPSDEEATITENLERELEYTKEQLHLSIEEYETSNEELRASNEELQSMNEEMQSTTEELETSQEELQSVNEELKTVNNELENKVDKLSQANSDLKNLMEATEVGILFVDNDLRMQRFTSQAAEIFNFIDTDKGRPLEHVTHQLKHENLIEDIKEVNKTLKKIKKVVSTDDERWYIMRIRPYRSTENKIEGVVLSFVEFTELKEVRKVAEDQPKQEALATLGVYALEQDDLEAIMKRAIEISCIVLHLDCAVIYAVNDEHGTLEIGAQAGCATEMEPLNISEEWDIGYALNSNEPTVVNSYEEEERFGISPFLKNEGVVSSLNITIRGSDRSFGLLGFYAREKREFTDLEVQFVQVIANIVGMAIQNKYAREDLEKEIERSTKFQREILQNSVAERWELGGFLHDELAQLMVSVKIAINQIGRNISDSAIDSGIESELEDVNKMVDEGISRIRNMTYDIIPVDIEDEGVKHALRILMQHMQKLYNVKCTLRTDQVINEIKDRKVATNLYHVVQEAIKNAALHGEAKHIIISVAKQDKNLRLKVKDDGMGLIDKKGEKDGKGLRIMQHRIELLGGVFEIEDKSRSDKETGTLVTCAIPLEYLKEQEE